MQIPSSILQLALCTLQTPLAIHTLTTTAANTHACCMQVRRAFCPTKNDWECDRILRGCDGDTRFVRMLAPNKKAVDDKILELWRGGTPYVLLAIRGDGKMPGLLKKLHIPSKFTVIECYQDKVNGAFHPEKEARHLIEDSASCAINGSAVILDFSLITKATCLHPSIKGGTVPREIRAAADAAQLSPSQVLAIVCHVDDPHPSVFEAAKQQYADSTVKHAGRKSQNRGEDIAMGSDGYHASGVSEWVNACMTQQIQGMWSWGCTEDQGRCTQRIQPTWPRSLHTCKIHSSSMFGSRMQPGSHTQYTLSAQHQLTHPNPAQVNNGQCMAYAGSTALKNDRAMRMYAPVTATLGAFPHLQFFWTGTSMSLPGLPVHRLHTTLNQSLTMHLDTLDLSGSVIAFIRQGPGDGSSRFYLHSLALTVPQGAGTFMYVRTDRVYHGSRAPASVDDKLYGYAMCNNRQNVTRFINQPMEKPW